MRRRFAAVLNNIDLINVLPLLQRCLRCQVSFNFPVQFLANLLALVAKTLNSFEYIHHHQIFDAHQKIPFPPYTMRMRQMSQFLLRTDGRSI